MAKARNEMEILKEVAGRQLRLRYTFNSICAIEDRAGCALEEIMKRKYAPVRLLFWGALTELQPEISLSEAGDIIGAHIYGGGRLEDIAGMCLEALERAGFRAA